MGEGNIAHPPPPSPVRAIPIPRDCSHGEIKQFALEYPAPFEGSIDIQEFRQYIRRLNSLLAEAEAPLRRHAIDHILAFLTLNLSSLIIPTYYDRAMKKVFRFINEQNESLFIPNGYRVTDPRKTAFLFLEVVPLSLEGRS
ncbi:Golgin subfamily A member 7/ERF4 [Dimargaris cristalligena]|uniref:Ras modification protein ERF4 n=1 Tax=Dimargaris cristalligena TaxID=215637 RepID=A0A4Q0A2G5_9FUNG|nr:Golgin subfamily A member 7/ERF4 [Dimargaris cristalligena]|eukprot:RKP40257.1 Golgin subfamily A member 7/ERF4 [Dimargaris cristalligena]